MGVHTGDSITVAPAQTLTDREYQILRDLAHRVLSAVGVETGGSNVQFAVDPNTGRVVVIEMNPRVSRSSALASKATGFPIAKLAALVAIGYTLDEITNDITKQTKAAFEPSLDYVVVKIPRWAFEKFPGVDPNLGPQMKSVGEAMALGRTFPEALNKAIQSLPIGYFVSIARFDKEYLWRRLHKQPVMIYGFWPNCRRSNIANRKLQKPYRRKNLNQICIMQRKWDLPIHTLRDYYPIPNYREASLLAPSVQPMFEIFARN
jgi:hypothetical protein